MKKITKPTYYLVRDVLKSLKKIVSLNIRSVLELVIVLVPKDICYYLFSITTGVKS